ncbi:MAG: crossover junction endodeoxyribonuclease RuvC [Firmicutes bacterium]|nr:crossover junction endodeoxyribonuclease RuvC [Bacillota bacterium]
MIILGLDPGTAITGYGLIEAVAGSYRLLNYGCIRTEPGHSDAARLLKLHEDLCFLLDAARPEQVAVEKLFFNRNTTTAVPVGQARGVLLLTCAQRDLPIGEYTPLEVKQALTGYGRADKKQIQYMVAKLLRMKEIPKPDDAADALAIAITHAHYYRNAHLWKEGQ